MSTSRILDLLDISPYVRYVHSCTQACSHSHQVPWRCIYDYELIFVEKGILELVTEEEVFAITENTVHTIPPLLYHTIKIPDGQACTYYSIHFDFIDLGRENDFSPDIYISECNRNLENVPLNERLSTRPTYSLGGMALPKLLHISDPVGYTYLWKNMIALQKEKPFAWELDMRSAMLSLLKRLLIDMNANTKAASREQMTNFSAITAYLVNHCGEEIDFEALSLMFGYSYRSFRRHFKEMCGKTPHEYLTKLRLDRASALLECGTYSVAEVAWMVGFEDSSYFTRLFRKHKGLSPKQVKQNRKQIL